ncbi:MAG: hypothetical protein WC447_01535 [Candidatus Paceibacterota bacterium]|jgi:hypothetical protein
MAFELDTENKSKNYLDEKELFILYYLSKNKHISTQGSNVFRPNEKTIYHKPDGLNDVAELEKNLNKHILEAEEKREKKLQSSIVANYLIGLGRTFDEKSFAVFGDADYSLVEGGFLTDDFHKEMYDYLALSKEKREKDKKLNKEQKIFLENIISKKLDLNDIETRVRFTKLANPPIKSYQEAILNKKAEKEFIELVNKLIKEHDGGKWNTEDVEKFLEIYYKHNKEQFKKNVTTPRTWLFEDNQTKLANLIFAHTDFHLFIKDNTKLNNYLKEYIKLFKKDELDKLSNKGLTGSFFTTSRLIPLNNQLWGFEKQKEILVQHIEKNFNEYKKSSLQISHPYFEPVYEGDTEEGITEITISPKNEDEADRFLFVHTIIALEYKKFLEIKSLFYGYMDLFDLYDRGFVFQIKLPKEVNNKDEEITEISKPVKKSNIKPFLVTKNKKGYLKFAKNSPNIFIGSITTRKFRLLQALMEPIETIGTARKIDKVFEAIKLPRDNNDPKLKDNYLSRDRKLSIIQYTIKEIQKIKKLQRKIHFSFGENNQIIWADFT